MISGIIVLVLLFIDGIIFGVAAAKGILSIVLIILGLILAAFIGVAIPFLSSGIVLSHLSSIVTTQAKYFSYYIYGFPLAWIVGFIVGLLLV
jgi:hypothetical protein